MNRSAMYYYAAGGVIQKSLALLMLPMTASLLGVAAFGQLGLLVAVANVGSLVASLGLTECCQRYASNPAMQRRILAFGWRYGCVLILVSPLLAWGLARLLPGELHWFWLQMLLLNLSAGTWLALRLVSLRINNRPDRFFRVSVSVSALQTGLSLLLLLLGLGVDALMISGVVATVAVLLWDARPMLVRAARSAIGSWQPIVGYGLPLALSTGITFVLNGYERPWLADAVSLEALGAYVLVWQLSLLPAYAMEPFMLWWGPLRHQLADNGQLATLARVTTAGVALLVAIIGIVATLLPFILSWLFDSTYQQGQAWLPILLMITLLRQIPALLSIGVYHRITGNLALMLNAIVMVPALIVLPLAIAFDGLPGLLVAMGMLMATRALLFYRVSQRHLRLPYSPGLLLGLTVCTALALWIGHPALLLTLALVAALYGIRTLKTGTGSVAAAQWQS
ncbi:Membrane protein involved in the export of O-antigen and teichoic acid [Ferrimonas sediminum]|uniref:Membrane protein involved in the export of O-antigen and teichoic acid n=1 Tax=Ferrimonas sediminum TaxID=718193 RepID=A0A1G8S5T7_9GAMM|nr:oligosaccharide flippase family protein [Ferrimonas sediminum]SDJ24589.1 Membrane protein involved in the export of O-antigen and teichoic acid [Ferrimonas sediminum]